MQMSDHLFNPVNPYRYNAQDINDSLELLEKQQKWSHFRVCLPSPLKSGLFEHKPIIGDYIYPKNVQRAPLVILIHGMGGRSVIPCKLIARTLAQHGIASFILYLIFHENRISAELKKKYPNLSSDEWFDSYRISVTDVMKVIDWSMLRPEIAVDKIALAGISFGGFISAITMGLDKRIAASILFVMGGNSEKITRHSFLLRRQYKLDENEYEKNQQQYRKFLIEVEKSGLENVDIPKRSYLTDPLTYCFYLRNRPVLMINALWDEMIPRTATLDMWNACGKPPLIWFPATHASIWLWYPMMSLRISGFLKSVFK